MANDNNPKRRQGALKAPLEFMPIVAEALIALVLEGGAKKYGAFNWRKEDISVSTYVGAVRRHIGAIADGEMIDPESGFPHWAHIAASASIAMDADALGKLINDIKLDGNGPEVLRGIHAEREAVASDVKIDPVPKSLRKPGVFDGMVKPAGDEGRDNDWPDSPHGAVSIELGETDE